ncbi:MAG: DUF3817 domain-containing protein [Candidatus Sericytochromatia bacterium]|nr:DUF3817 domain-containing protein [Candidatus Sericytochromatia bacterium]
MNKNLLKSQIGRLRLVGISEGVSFIVLLGIAMPLKYIFDLPQAVRVVGMMHGALFILYLITLIESKIEFGWDYKRFSSLMLAALIPFGTFYTDNKILKYIK